MANTTGIGDAKLKQSKKQLPALLAEFVKEAREEAAEVERNKYAAEIQKLVGGLLAITNKLAALGGVDCTVEVQRNAFAKEKPQPKKRKAVEASDDQVESVGDVFRSFNNFPVLAPAKIKIPGIGTQTIAAACRSLVQSRVLEKVGTKGYRLAPKENGLDETMPARTPAE